MSKHNHDHGNSGDTKADTKVNPTEKKDDGVLPDGAQQASSASGSPETEGLEAKPVTVNWEQRAAELEAKLADLNDQLLRKAADFENYRKRMIREKQEITEFANQNLILDLLPVIDDFERAIKSAETSQDFKSFYEGVTMIEKRLSTDLENKWGLKRFDSEGQPFDPNRHEALQVEKAAGIQEAVVKEDYVKGYLLKDRVIRFAKVKVLMPDDTESAGEA
jgi:molecular chaperone GrpE